MVIYSHLGDFVTMTSLADLVPEENVNRYVFNINICNCRVINKVHKNQDKVVWRALANEMYNHADTHCFGSRI